MEAAMKKALCAILAALILAALAGCAKKTDDKTELPKPANDPEVLAKWDEYGILDPVPRYTGTGFFENVYEGKNGMTVVSYLAVPADDFETYALNMSNYGFTLDPESSIWMTEGISGVPIFKKGSVELTLVWNVNGTLDIGVSKAAQ